MNRGRRRSGEKVAFLLEYREVQDEVEVPVLVGIPIFLRHQILLDFVVILRRASNARGMRRGIVIDDQLRPSTERASPSAGERSAPGRAEQDVHVGPGAVALPLLDILPVAQGASPVGDGAFSRPATRSFAINFRSRSARAPPGSHMSKSVSSPRTIAFAYSRQVS